MPQGRIAWFLLSLATSVPAQINWDAIMEHWEERNNVIAVQGGPETSAAALADIEAHRGAVQAVPAVAGGLLARTIHERGGPHVGWGSDRIEIRASFLDPTVWVPRLQMLWDDPATPGQEVTPAEAAELHNDMIVGLMMHEATHAAMNGPPDPAHTPEQQEACREVEAYSAEMDFWDVLLEIVAGTPLEDCATAVRDDRAAWLMYFEGICTG